MKKRGFVSKKMLALTVLACLRLGNTAYGAEYTVPEITISGGGSAPVSVSSGNDNTLNLTTDGFNKVETGKHVEREVYDSEDTINSLFSATYEAPYNAYKNAADAYALAQAAFDDDNSPELETAMNAAWDELQSKEQALKDVCSNSSNKLVMSAEDVKKIFESPAGEVLQYSRGQETYKDAISGKELQINVKKDLVYSQNELGLPESPITISYDKPTSDDPVNDPQQHDNLHIVQVTGSGTVLDVNGNGDPATVYELEAVSKNGSGVFDVRDGAELNFNTSISYKTGGSEDVGTEFKDTSKSISSSMVKGNVTWGGIVSTPFGTFDVHDAESANKYNDELIKFIQKDEKTRLMNQEQVQAFYDEWAGQMYTITGEVDASYKYNWDQQKLQEIADKSIKDGDIGTASTSDNYFVGVHDSNSEINIKEGVVIDGNNSGGTIIKGDFDTSGTSGSNTLNVNGTLKGVTTAVDAVNMDINVSATGQIKGSIILDKGKIDNKGEIGNTTIANGTLNNTNKVNGYVSADKSQITNDGEITGSVIGKNGSALLNTGTAVIKGDVSFTGEYSKIKNEGTINGSVSATNGAKVTNASDVVGSGKTVVSITTGSNYEGLSNSNIYIGYTSKDQWDDPSTPKAAVSNISSGVSRPYTGINIEGGSFENQGTIYIAGSQVEVVGVRISGDAVYKDYAGAEIILNKEKDRNGLDASRANNNTAILVENVKDYDTKPVEINSSITLNDVGGTGLEVRNYADVTLKGDVNLNSESGGVTYGVFVDGSHSDENNSDPGTPKLTLVDSNININTDKGIGLHIRNGGIASIEGDSQITFASDKTKQIGVLLSGNVSESNLKYNSSQELLVKGVESVLFRVERGATFDVGELLNDPGNPAKIALDSNNSDKSSLFVATGGATLGNTNPTQLTIDKVEMIISGEDSMGIRVEGGAQATIGKDTQIKLSGKNNVVAKVDGYYYDLDGLHQSANDGASLLTSSLTLSNDNFQGAAEDSIGYHVLNGGKLIHDGTIDFTTSGNELIGVLLTNGGQLESKKDSKIEVNGTAVKIVGATSTAVINNEGGGSGPLIHATDGTAAYQLTDNAKLKLTGSGLTQADKSAHAILIDAGSSQSAVTLDGAKLKVTGTGSGIENAGNATNITLKNTAEIEVNNGAGIHSAIGFSPSSGSQSGVINVEGNGTGILFENMDGSMTDNAITFTQAKDLVVNVKGAKGKGIVANTSKAVNTTGSVNVINANGNAALEVNGTTGKVDQGGNLHSAAQERIVKLSSTVSSFTNSGDMLFGSFTQNGDSYTFAAEKATDRIAVEKTGTTTINFTNTNSGKINGVVRLTAANGTQGNIVTLNAGSQGNEFITGSGNDTFTVSKITGSDKDGVTKQFNSLDGGSGDDTLTFNSSSNYTVTNADTIKNIEKISITGSSKLTLDKVLPNGTDTFGISGDSTLHYNIADSKTGSSAFAKQVEGAGLFTVEGKPAQASDNLNFDFGTKQTGFNGTFETINVSFDLKGVNQQSLVNATLRGSANSTINVGTGEQNVKGVHMNGADFVFDDITPDALTDNNHVMLADSNIKTDTLTLSSGTVIVDVADIKNPVHPDTLDSNKESLLKHDDANRYIQLIQAKDVANSQNINQINIVDSNNMPLATTAVDVNQNNKKVANAKYGITAAVITDKVGSNYENGLYATIGLTEIELLEQEETAGNALRLNAFGEDEAEARTLSAKLTGAGDVVITGEKEVILRNDMGSTYTGKTIVDANAALKTGAHGSFGATSELVLQANSNTDLNGQQETVGALTAAAGSVLDLNGGTLTIGTAQNTGNKDSYSNGSLKGSGTLNVKDTNLYVDGANNDLSAAVNNNGTSQIFVELGDSLGTGVITMSDTSKLVADIDSDTSFTNTFAAGDATATLVKNGSGTLTFNADQAAYEAKTEMNGGKLVFDGGDVASQEIDINGGLLRANEGTQFAGVINNNAVMVALKDTRVNNDFHNTGALYVGHNIGDTVANGDKVYVDNYEGTAGSSLHFLGQLGDDNSTINNLVIENDSTGESLVYVRNSDGMGGQTSQGIKLIEVKGNSDAEFIAGDRIIAGAYTYELQRGDSLGNNMKDWFLTSRLSQEPLAYYANYLAANDVLDLRLQDRTGSKEFTEYLKDGEEEKADSLWARSVYYKKSYWDDDKFNKTSANSNYFQMGYDVAQWKKANNRFHVGVMAGYYNGSNSISGVEDTSTSGKVDLYTAGIYGTWLKNHNDKEQTYLDTWVQYIWGDNEIKNQHINEKYDVNGVAVSFEVGHSMEVSQSENKKHYIEPKAQLIWSNLEQETFDWAVNNNNGAAVNSFKQKTDYQLISRMGIRLASKTKADPLKKKYSNSFAELNWLHYFKDYEFSVGKDQLEMGIKDKAEIKIGLEKQFNKNCSIWANGFIQVAENSYRNVGAQLGVKYTF
ncbi:autotransporter outer membrane beta-barrel domain-containing protein [uncultured Phascolarctobacterium sp.]|uniref:autotransporter outer membrane beta-barrel domain-containing protein n=1 Tax=uncultured Phascolarctobacterium sp. TaxID=512296 RepID=UPI00260BB287|nr:autotransporter outer membrane beta-barrel domain-containing protein [uncultured Phascolarctobacterium sp.]